MIAYSASRDSCRIRFGELTVGHWNYLGCLEISLLREAAVRAFVAGSDVFLSIPTGVGSRCASAVLPRSFSMFRGNGWPQS